MMGTGMMHSARQDPQWNCGQRQAQVTQGAPPYRSHDRWQGLSYHQKGWRKGPDQAEGAAMAPGVYKMQKENFFSSRSFLSLLPVVTSVSAYWDIKLDWLWGEIFLLVGGCLLVQGVSDKRESLPRTGSERGEPLAASAGCHLVLGEYCGHVKSRVWNCVYYTIFNI